MSGVEKKWKVMGSGGNYGLVDMWEGEWVCDLWHTCMWLVQGNLPFCGGAPVVVRRYCHLLWWWLAGKIAENVFFIFLPLFDSSRPSMAPTSEGWFMHSLASRSHGWLLNLFSEVRPKVIKNAPFVLNYFKSYKWPEIMKTLINNNKMPSDKLNYCD